MSNDLLDVRQSLLDDINAQQGLSLTKTDVTWDAPILVNPSIIDMTSSQRNSRLGLTAIGTDLSLNINYNRLSLTKLFEYRNKIFADGGETSVHDLLAKLSIRLGGYITSADVEDSSIDRSGEEPAFTLTAKSGSLGLFGSVTLTLSADMPEDPEPSVYLQGLGYPYQ
ncbi:hypothetical protein LUCX_273 [Xanthomonas phage vB_XciM_LucasX]|nr:hypothetical protein LUCX_273 [Xanthomonas phage vB_XciM_LucasX]